MIEETGDFDPIYGCVCVEEEEEAEAEARERGPSYSCCAGMQLSMPSIHPCHPSTHPIHPIHRTPLLLTSLSLTHTHTHQSSTPTQPTPTQHRSKGVRDQIYLYLWSLVKRETRYSSDIGNGGKEEGKEEGV
jgi:hypothetical protein